MHAKYSLTREPGRKKTERERERERENVRTKNIIFDISSATLNVEQAGTPRSEARKQFYDSTIKLPTYSAVHSQNDLSVAVFFFIFQHFLTDS